MDQPQTVHSSQFNLVQAGRSFQSCWFCARCFLLFFPTSHASLYSLALHTASRELPNHLTACGQIALACPNPFSSLPSLGGTTSQRAHWFLCFYGCFRCFRCHRLFEPFACFRVLHFIYILIIARNVSVFLSFLFHLALCILISLAFHNNLNRWITCYRDISIASLNFNDTPK